MFSKFFIFYLIKHKVYKVFLIHIKVQLKKKKNSLVNSVCVYIYIQIINSLNILVTYSLKYIREYIYEVDSKVTIKRNNFT